MNPPPLLWLSEISGAVHLAQPGLTAGRQADEIQVNFEFFKIHCTTEHSTFRFIYPRYSIITAVLMYFQVVFSGKTYCFLKCEKFQSHIMISY